MATTGNHHVRINRMHRLRVAWEQRDNKLFYFPWHAKPRIPLPLGFGKRFIRNALVNASIISALAFGPSATQPRPSEPEPATNLVHASASAGLHLSLCSFSLPATPPPRPLFNNLFLWDLLGRLFQKLSVVETTSIPF